MNAKQKHKQKHRRDVRERRKAAGLPARRQVARYDEQGNPLNAAARRAAQRASEADNG